MQKESYKTKNAYASKITVSLIENGLNKLKDNIDNNMSKEELEIEK